jgi:YVTN family beta-propeller protein
MREMLTVPLCAVAHLLFCSFVMAQSSSPSLLVLNKEDNNLSVIDPVSLKPLATIPTGEGPHEVTVSDDGRWAYVSNYGAFGAAPGHTISVIDLVNRKSLREVELGGLSKPHGIEFVNGKVYFTAELSRAIGRYDPATNQVDWVMGTGQNRTHMLFPSRDLGKIVTTNVDSDSVSILEKSKDATGWSETVVQVGKGPEGGSFSPDEKEFWAANSQDGSVSIVEMKNKKVTQTFDVGTKRSNRLKFTPDGRLVLISDLGSGDVVFVEAAGRNVIKRLHVGKNAEGILLMPDGSLAYVAAAADNRVVIVDLKKLEIVGEIQTGKGPDGMAWAVR